jgi:predicted enzyme related to lactoylglutathione lyase
MHRSRFCNVIIDCQVEDLDEAARFWSRAFGRAIKPFDDPNYRELVTGEDELIIMVQKVSHPSRAHLDIETDDLEAEVKRLEGLGAKRVGFVKRWWVMEAPTGQKFCVVGPQRGQLGPGANEWADS